MKHTLENYLLSLGKLALFVTMLADEQKAYQRSGVLTDDEIELSETIKHECDKLLRCMNDQVRMCGERTPKTWEETLKDLEQTLKCEGKNGYDKSERIVKKKRRK